MTSTVKQQSLRDYVSAKHSHGVLTPIESCNKYVLDKFEQLSQGIVAASTQGDHATSKSFLQQLGDFLDPSGADAAQGIKTAEQAAIAQRQQSLFDRTLTAVPSSCWPSLGTKGLRDVQKLEQGHDGHPVYVISMVPTVSRLGGSQFAFVNAASSEWDAVQYEQTAEGSWQVRTGGATSAFDKNELEERIRASSFWGSASKVLDDAYAEIRQLENSNATKTDASAAQVNFARLARPLDVVRQSLARSAAGCEAWMHVHFAPDQPVQDVLRRAREINTKYTQLSSKGRVPSAFEVDGQEFKYSSLNMRW